jgi:hypothetical protein
MTTQEERHEYYLSRKRRGQIYIIPDAKTSELIRELAENRKWSHSKTAKIILEDYAPQAYEKYIIKE